MASSTLRCHSPIAFSSSRYTATAVPPCSSRLPLYSEFKGLKIKTQMPSNLRTAMVSRLVCGARDTVTDFPTVTDETWRSLVLEAEVPVLVEFSAPWCGPCRIIHPVVAELSQEYAGKINFFKLNTDQSPSIATKYGIRTVPAMMIFVNGEKKDAVIGAVPKTTLTTAIERFL